MLAVCVFVKCRYLLAPAERMLQPVGIAVGEIRVCDFRKIFLYQRFEAVALQPFAECRHILMAFERDDLGVLCFHEKFPAENEIQRYAVFLAPPAAAKTILQADPRLVQLAGTRRTEQLVLVSPYTVQMA